MPQSKQNKDIEALSVAAIRSLVIDMINDASSGHPGMALDAAPALYALFRDHLNADPKHPDWRNRDRLVFSSGHASALLYALLHLGGYHLSLEDLKAFRQLGSITPGHPEIGMTPGVDATAGPLGQGIAQAVGMAMAEKHIAASYPEGKKLCHHRVYCLCGDGCLQEGIAQEAISLAGHLRLNRLILLYDCNTSTLDGPTSNSMTENVKLRFLSEEWNVIEVKDGDSVSSMSKAIAKARRSKAYPTLILFHTLIGKGSKKEGTSATHGAPLGEEDGAFAKASYGYDYPKWTVPSAVYEDFAAHFAARGGAKYEYDCQNHEQWKQAHPSEAKVYEDACARNFVSYLPKRESFEIKAKEATRRTSGRYLNALAESMPFTFGGSADVAGSVMTKLSGGTPFSYEHPEGKDMNWGIREFAMLACSNGIHLHGGLYAYGGMFLIFSDYAKPAFRMAAMEHLPLLALLSHDSIAVGEDGATHQPIEQLASLRSIPGLTVIRPCDGKETVGAYEAALKNVSGPTAIILSRQDLPLLENSSIDETQKGAYFIQKDPEAEILILASGSEVSLALEVSKKLSKKASIVSMPSWELFEKQSQEYRDSVLYLPYEKRISLEMLSTFGWAKYAKNNIGLDTYGASGKSSQVIASCHFDADSIAQEIEKRVK